MTLWKFVIGLARNVRGGPATEAALLIALVAAIAGFGMIMLGDAMAVFFTAASNALDPAGIRFPGSS